MQTLRIWRTKAEERGYTRLAELCDYLQADELTHVKLATHWIRELTDNDRVHRDELVRWGTDVVIGMERFWADDPASVPTNIEVHFSFLRSHDDDSTAVASTMIGE